MFLLSRTCDLISLSPPPPPSLLTLSSQVAKADPSVLKPELVDIVASALAGHGRETLGLREFCEILDASLRNATTRGPTAHFFSTPDRGTSSAAGEGTAAAASAAAERALQEEEAELKEMTFRPKIGKKSTTIARLMGRDGSKVRRWCTLIANDPMAGGGGGMNPPGLGLPIPLFHGLISPMNGVFYQETFIESVPGKGLNWRLYPACLTGARYRAESNWISSLKMPHEYRRIEIYVNYIMRHLSTTAGTLT